MRVLNVESTRLASRAAHSKRLWVAVEGVRIASRRRPRGSHQRYVQQERNRSMRDCNRAWRRFVIVLSAVDRPSSTIRSPSHLPVTGQILLSGSHARVPITSGGTGRAIPWHAARLISVPIAPTTLIPTSATVKITPRRLPKGDPVSFRSIGRIQRAPRHTGQLLGERSTTTGMGWRSREVGHPWGGPAAPEATTIGSGRVCRYGKIRGGIGRPGWRGHNRSLLTTRERYNGSGCTLRPWTCQGFLAREKARGASKRGRRLVM